VRADAGRFVCRHIARSIAPRVDRTPDAHSFLSQGTKESAGAELAQLAWAVLLLATWLLASPTNPARCGDQRFILIAVIRRSTRHLPAREGWFNFGTSSTSCSLGVLVFSSPVVRRFAGRILDLDYHARTGLVVGRYACRGAVALQTAWAAAPGSPQRLLAPHGPEGGPGRFPLACHQLVGQLTAIST